jgi:predicted metal-dependent hydrolase
MLFDWTNGALADGLRCYRNQEFFEAHEYWESEWLKCEEPEKTFLQALIQITAAFHHLQRGNPAGTASLLRASLRRLDNFPAYYKGVAVEELRENARAWLDALQLSSGLRQLRFPHIRVDVTNTKEAFRS